MCRLLEIESSEDHSEAGVRRRMEMLLSRYPAEAVVVTRGGQGAVLLTRDHEISVGTAYIPSGELYPVGAGDACAAGVLFGLTLGWDHYRTLELANRMGAWVASEQSATPCLPDTILEFARKSMSIKSHS